MEVKVENPREKTENNSYEDDTKYSVHKMCSDTEEIQSDNYLTVCVDSLKEEKTTITREYSTDEGDNKRYNGIDNRSFSEPNGNTQGISDGNTCNSKRISLDQNQRDDADDNNGTSDRKWLIILLSFLSIGIGTGFPFNMSVLYVEFLEEFQRSNSETAAVQSVCTGVFLIGGFVSGLIVTKFGPRKCGILGGLMAALGLSLSYFASNIFFLVICIGVISGSGFSLTYVSSSSVVGMYFKGKQRLMALAFISLGGGVGATIIPIGLEALVKEYSWRGTLLIFSGIMLHLVVNASLFKPPPDQTKRKQRVGSSKNVRNTPLKSICKNCDSTASNDILPHSSSIGTVQSASDEQKTVSFSISDFRRVHERNEVGEKKKRLLDILKEVLKNKIFLSYIFAQSITIGAFNSVLIFFIDLYQFNGLSRSQAVNIYMYMNIVSTVTRFIPGVLKQAPHVSVVSIPAFSSLFGAISMFVFTVAGTSYYLNLAAACTYGIGLGGIVTVLGISIIKLVGQENYSTGLGIAMTLSGIANSAAGPISGFIRDKTGNYNMSLYAAGFALIVSSVLFFITLLCRTYSCRDEASRFDLELTIRRISRRRSSIMPWRKKSVDVSNM